MNRSAEGVAAASILIASCFPQSMPNDPFPESTLAMKRLEVTLEARRDSLQHLETAVNEWHSTVGNLGAGEQP
jgi:hypothetical protein